MREVPAVLYGFMCQAIGRGGVDTASCARGLSLADVDPRRFGARVDWDELATFLNRCARGMSDVEQEAVGERYVVENRYITFLALALRSPRLYHRLAWKASKPAFPHMEFGYEELSDGRLRLTMRLPSHYRGSEFFFRATAAEIRAITTLMNLPPTEVEADVASHHGVYMLRLPDEPSLATGLARDGRRMLEVVSRELQSMLSWVLGHDPEPSEFHLERLQREHGLTQAEARVATHLARGLSVPEIAGELGITVETVRTHLKRAYAKTGARGQVGLARVVLGNDART